MFYFIFFNAQPQSCQWGKMRRISADAIVVSQTRRSIEKVLEWENSRLYHKVRYMNIGGLGNVWKCAKT